MIVYRIFPFLHDLDLQNEKKMESLQTLVDNLIAEGAVLLVQHCLNPW